jgi:CHAT domain-containing protein
LTTGELTGGGYALDGLVRAFVGAGARSVVASHWPVPEKPIDATTQLISDLFSATPGQSLARQLQEAQRHMMDRAETSHPYYWASFAIIGDGATPLVPRN